MINSLWHNQIRTHYILHACLSVVASKIYSRLKRGSRWGADPSWDLSEMGYCVEVWYVGEGVQLLFLPFFSYYYHFLLRSPVLYKHITCIHNSKFNVQYGTVILSLYFPHHDYENNITSNPLLLWKGMFIFFMSRITRFTPLKTKYFFFGRGPIDPPPQTHLQYQIYQIICVFV